MRRFDRLLAIVTVAALLLGGLPAALPAAQATPAGGATHYHWQTLKSTGTDNLTALPTNVMYEAEGARTRAFKLYNSTVYGPAGPSRFVTYYMYNALGTYTDPNTNVTTRYGLPYRIISRAHEFPAINENMWLELAQMPDLDTTGLGAVNVSMDYFCPTGSGTTNVAFSRSMQVYVTLDGTNWLPGYAGVRSARLVGGGTLSSGGTSFLQYLIESENLLDIPGVEPGDVIRGIKILPNGPYCRTFGSFITKAIDVNTWPTVAAFDADRPSDLPEMIDLGEDTMRAIVVAEGVRTANIPWTATQDIITTFPSGSSAYSTGTASRTYKAGRNFRGPTYERDTDSTRELFVSSIVGGVYGRNNGAGYDMSAGEDVYGMDCQTFVFNAISRVSRSYAWSVMNTFGETYVRLLGDLTVNDHAAYSDVDVVELNNAQQMYESYALAKAGDVAIHYLTDNSNSVHTRVVKSVSVVRNSDGSINPSSSKMYFTEQSSTTYGYDSSGGRHTDKEQTGGYDYYSTTHENSSFTFSSLRSSGYIVYTLTDYAAGKVQCEDVQAVCAPLVKDGSFSSGVHLAFCSNYRIIKYAVTLRDMGNSTDLFTETKWCKAPNTVGINYENATLNSMLADLPAGDYRLSLAVDSGPLTSTTQVDVPTTVKNFDFQVDATFPCTGSHAGRSPLTQEDLNGLPVVSPSGNGPYSVLPAGSYYLTENVSLPRSIVIEAGSAVTLCLNGHTLEGTLAADSDTNRYYQNAFLFVAGALTLCDHTDTGTVRVNAGGEITSSTYSAYAIQVTGSLDLHDGGVSGSHGRYGAILVNNSGEMNMTGGTISGNVNVGYTSGGAVELQNNGTFNMYGGTISGNGSASTRGSGVDVNGTVGTDPSPVFNMYGGTVTGNTGCEGAGVCVRSGGAFNMNGGTVSANVSSDGTEVLISGNGASMTMAGGALGAEGTANTLVFRGAASNEVTGEFTDGTVYLTVETDGAADFDVALQGGDFAGIGDGHSGVAVTGGRFASSAWLLDCGVGSRLGVVATGNSDFPYTLAENVGIPGDINGDDKVNGKDVVMLQRFVVGGYGVDLPIVIADLNKDAVVDSKDVVVFLRYMAGGYGVVL